VLVFVVVRTRGGGDDAAALEHGGFVTASGVDRLAAALEHDGFFGAGAVERRRRSIATAVDRVERQWR
jgi:hypothetical protein